ncbi:MAG TPA: NAD(P)-binding domain-containing protein [Candidatus Limnocylindria bacterium]|nr:NAD(P)-binding domain-containing protein [Candidatus Limnocylindria bacterium]
MRVAVVGAGVSGLVSLKWLREEGLDAVAFERSDRVGGLWNAKPLSPAYRSLVANVSREKTSLSDHPLPADVGDFPPRAAIARWLDAYADRFDLRRHVRFGHEVRRVEPRWTVDGERFDAVVLASGMFTRPHLPELEGRFDGRILHSYDYDVPEPFSGLDVVIVGGGSSAADIAVELSRVARRVTMSVRGALPTVPKTIRGVPFDRRQTRLARLIPLGRRLASRRRAILEEWARRGVDVSALPPAVAVVPPPGVAPAPSETLVPAIASGAVAVRPGIARLGGSEIVYTDGSRDRADVIVAATGYALDFPYLPGALWPVRDGRTHLYRHVFHPDEPTLAVVGFNRVSGPVPPIAEMQARWAARVLAGRASLPSRDEMHAEIAARVERAERTGAEYQRVQYVDYLDEIGALIGAKPSLWARPWLLWSTVTAEQYR